MQKVYPYKSLSGALKALDNGGRFYHLFTQAGDGVVTAVELKKAAGKFLDDQATSLFFDLALSGLDDAARAEIEAALGPEARGLRKLHRPTWLAPAAFPSQARAGKPYVLEGTVERVDDEDVAGVIFIPMMVGSVTTIMPIPITHRYSVYTLRGSSPTDPCLILTPKQAVDLHGDCLFGGVAKEGEVGEGAHKRKVLRLEARYYTRPGG